METLEMGAIALGALAIREALGLVWRVFRGSRRQEEMEQIGRQLADLFELLRSTAYELSSVHHHCHDIVRSVKTADGVPTAAILKSIDKTTDKLAGIQDKAVQLLSQIITEVRK